VRELQQQQLWRISSRVAAPMDPVTLYVILITASGERQTLHQVSFATMRECRAMAPSMRHRDWGIPPLEVA
jgi:hypothetical protein